MGKKYSTQTSSTYADDTPANDGSQVASNRVDINLLRTNYTDPIKDLADNINTNLVEHFDNGPASITATYVTVATDYGKVLECTNTIAVDLLAAATGGAGYFVTLVNAGSGTVTARLADSTDTVDGTTNGTVAISDNQARTFIVNAGATGYITAGGSILNGRKIDLDADGDTSIRADTDDQITVEIGGTDHIKISGTGISNVMLDILSAAFTSSGSSTILTGFQVAPDLTAANGDTGHHEVVRLTGTITTQGNTETITNVSQVQIDEPNITVGAGDTVTDACTLRLSNAPSEGTNNHALLVDNGDITLVSGELVFKETTTPTARADYGKIYTKSDNKLYFQDGAGTEHEVSFV